MKLLSIISVAFLYSVEAATCKSSDCPAANSVVPKNPFPSQCAGNVCTQSECCDPGDAQGTCTKPFGNARTCTCGNGFHGADTLEAREAFRGCFANPTGINAWVIKMKSSNPLNYDKAASKITFAFEKSGGRAHEVQLFKGDCTTKVSGADLLAIPRANVQVAGVSTDDKNEYLEVKVNVDLNKLASSKYLNNAKDKVELCVRVDIKTATASVNFIETKLVMVVDLTAIIQDAVVQIKRGPVVVYDSGKISKTYKLNACQCGVVTLATATSRCVAAAGKTVVATTAALTQSDLLGICISTEDDRVQIEQITSLTLTQGSGNNKKTFTVLANGAVARSDLSEYTGTDKNLGHIQRASTRILTGFFDTAGTPQITVSGTAKIKFKASRRRLRSLQDVTTTRSSSSTAPDEERPFSFKLNLDSKDTSVDAVSAAIARTLVGAMPLVAAAAFTL